MKTGRRRKYCSPVTYTTVSLLSSPVGTLVVDFSIRGSARFGLALVAPLRRGPTAPSWGVGPRPPSSRPRPSPPSVSGPGPFPSRFPPEQMAGCCTRGHRSRCPWFHRSPIPSSVKTATEREDTVRDAYEAAPCKHPNLEQTRRPLHQVMPTNRSPVLAASRAFFFVASLICARMLRTDIIVIEGRAAQDGKSTNDRRRP